MARVLVRGRCQLSQALLLQSQVSSFDAVFQQCTGDEETHLLEGADKGEQKLCGEDDFCLQTVPGRPTCEEIFFHFRQPPCNTLSCRLTRDECRHPFLIEYYTVLTLHRLGQGKKYCHVFSLNVKRKQMYRKHQGLSRIVSNPSRVLQKCQQTNRGAHNRITLMYTRAKN